MKQNNFICSLLVVLFSQLLFIELLNADTLKINKYHAFGELYKKPITHTHINKDLRITTSVSDALQSPKNKKAGLLKKNTENTVQFGSDYLAAVNYFQPIINSLSSQISYLQQMVYGTSNWINNQIKDFGSPALGQSLNMINQTVAENEVRLSLLISSSQWMINKSGEGLRSVVSLTEADYNSFVGTSNWVNNQVNDFGNAALAKGLNSVNQTLAERASVVDSLIGTSQWVVNNAGTLFGTSNWVNNQVNDFGNAALAKGLNSANQTLAERASVVDSLIGTSQWVVNNTDTLLQLPSNVATLGFNVGQAQSDITTLYSDYNDLQPIVMGNSQWIFNNVSTLFSTSNALNNIFPIVRGTSNWVNKQVTDFGLGFVSYEQVAAFGSNLNLNYGFFGLNGENCMFFMLDSNQNLYACACNGSSLEASSFSSAPFKVGAFALNQNDSNIVYYNPTESLIQTAGASLVTTTTVTSFAWDASNTSFAATTDNVVSVYGYDGSNIITNTGGVDGSGNSQTSYAQYDYSTSTLAGHPTISGLYAFVIEGSSPILQLIQWTSGTTALNNLVSIDYSGMLTAINTIAWDPTGTYLVVGGTASDGSPEVSIYSYNNTNNTLSVVTTLNTSGIPVQGCAWSPIQNNDESRSIVFVYGSSFGLYTFNGTSLSLQASQALQDQINNVNWIPNGAAFVLTGLSGMAGAGNNTLLYNVLHNNVYGSLGASVRTTSNAISVLSPLVRTTSNSLSSITPVVRGTSQWVTNNAGTLFGTSNLVNNLLPVVVGTSNWVASNEADFKTGLYSSYTLVHGQVVSLNSNTNLSYARFNPLLSNNEFSVIDDSNAVYNYSYNGLNNPPSLLSTSDIEASTLAYSQDGNNVAVYNPLEGNTLLFANYPGASPDVSSTAPGGVSFFAWDANNTNFAVVSGITVSIYGHSGGYPGSFITATGTGDTTALYSKFGNVGAISGHPSISGLYAVGVNGFTDPHEGNASIQIIYWDNGTRLIDPLNDDLYGDYSSDTVTAIAWDPTGNYIALGGNDTYDQALTCKIYSYNFNTNSLSLIDGFNSAQAVQDFAWNPIQNSDGTYSIVVIYGATFEWYTFNGSNLTLQGSGTLNSTINNVNWTPDGLGFVLTGNANMAGTGYNTAFYETLSPASNHNLSFGAALRTTSNVVSLLQTNLTTLHGQVSTLQPIVYGNSQWIYNNANAVLSGGLSQTLSDTLIGTSNWVANNAGTVVDTSNAVNDLQPVVVGTSQWVFNNAGTVLVGALSPSQVATLNGTSNWVANNNSLIRATSNAMNNVFPIIRGTSQWVVNNAITILSGGLSPSLSDALIGTSNWVANNAGTVVDTSNAINDLLPIVVGTSQWVTNNVAVIRTNSNAVNAQWPLLRTTSNSVKSIVSVVRGTSSWVANNAGVVRGVSNNIITNNQLIRSTSNAIVSQSSIISSGNINNSQATDLYLQLAGQFLRNEGKVRKKLVHDDLVKVINDLTKILVHFDIENTYDTKLSLTSSSGDKLIEELLTDELVKICE